ncbi:hypothetical protein [Streptomyces sp. NEAU-NA10]|uniref:hypothetical protein n=1 Tax=Streptomyces sp. NEAU-NA10 TaxID=3416050 RepID=UPI003CC5742A
MNTPDRTTAARPTDAPPPRDTDTPRAATTRTFTVVPLAAKASRPATAEEAAR